MNRQQKSLIVIMLIGSFIVGAGVVTAFRTQVDLPEEYRLIAPTDNLKGHWEEGVLVIEFNNQNNK